MVLLVLYIHRLVSDDRSQVPIDLALGQRNEERVPVRGRAVANRARKLNLRETFYVLIRVEM